jgi:hypothetical protein
MIRHARLGLLEPAEELADAQFAALGQRFQDPQPCRVAEHAEVLGEQLRGGWLLGQREGADATVCRMVSRDPAAATRPRRP